MDEDIQARVARELDAVLEVRPRLREEPLKLRELAQLLEAQWRESEWYQDFPLYETDADVFADRGLVDLPAARREGRLRFDFKVLRESFWARIGRRLYLYANRLRRLLTGSTFVRLRETTAGMRVTRCKPAMAGFLNEFALRAADLGRRPSFRPRVNSILRTREHQLHLIRLGYIAPVRSSHCVGYAADIEKAWYEKEEPGLHSAMEEVLTEYRRAGVLNVIDEGLVWHVCLNPDRIRHYARLAEEG